MVYPAVAMAFPGLAVLLWVRSWLAGLDVDGTENKFLDAERKEGGGLKRMGFGLLRKKSVTWAR